MGSRTKEIQQLERIARVADSAVTAVKGGDQNAHLLMVIALTEISTLAKNVR